MADRDTMTRERASQPLEFVPCSGANADEDESATESSEDESIMDIDEESETKSESDSSETECKKEDCLADDLYYAMVGLQIFKYAYERRFPRAPNPGLRLEGHTTPLDLPLSSQETMLFMEHARQAPCLDAEDAMVQTQTWEIQPDRFSFDNLEWQTFVDQSVDIMDDGIFRCETLNKVPLRCVLDKLILHGPSSDEFVVKQPESSQKRQGFFGTLVIILPSQYSGGLFRISHYGDEKLLGFSSVPSSTNPLTSSLAWNANARCESGRITAGFRLSLVYSLVKDAPATLPVTPSCHRELADALSKWYKGKFTRGGNPDCMAYALSNKYTASELSQGLGALKPRDAEFVASVQRFAKRSRFMLCLGNLVSEIWGDPKVDYSNDLDSDNSDYDYLYERSRKRRRYTTVCEYGETPEMGHETDRSDIVRGLVDLKGKEFLGDKQKLTLEETQVMPTFEGENPDDKDFVLYEAHGAGAVVHTFRRTVLVLMLKDEVESRLVDAGGLAYATAKLAKTKKVPPTKGNLRLAELIMDRIKATDTAILADMYETAVLWRHLKIWKQIVSLVVDSRDLATESWIQKSAEAVTVFGFEPLRASYESILQSYKIGMRMGQRLSFLDTIHEQPSRTSEDKDATNAWHSGKLSDMMASIKDLPDTDVPALMNLARRFEYGECVDKLIVRLERNGGRMHYFWMAFVKALHAEKEARGGDAPNLDRIMDASVKVAVSFGCSKRPYNHPGEPESTRANKVVDLIDICITTNRLRFCDSMFKRLPFTSGKVENEFHDLYTPVILRLRQLLQKHSRKISEDPFKFLMQNFVGRYLEDMLGAKPDRSAFALPKVGCSRSKCNDCKSLEDFMMGSLPEITIRVAKPRKAHLEERIKMARTFFSYKIIPTGTPHGIHIVRLADPAIAAIDRWTRKARWAREFLAKVGDEVLLRDIMGDRYPDVEKALDGTQLFVLPISPAPLQPPPLVSETPAPAKSDILVTTSLKRKAV